MMKIMMKYNLTSVILIYQFHLVHGAQKLQGSYCSSSEAD